MGIVLQVEHLHLKQFRAVKIIKFARHVGEHSSLIARFRREMQAIGALEHTHVVRAFDAGEHEGQFYLVMEYVDGLDLEQLARTLGPLSQADACELMRQAALGLVEIHAGGWVHRDIKPSNLLFSRRKVVKVADLGLARLRESSDPVEVTPQGGFVGTPDYMAPEQWTAPQSADGRADLYSLGCCLYRLVTGEVLFPAPQFTSYPEKLLAHQRQPAPSLPGPLGDILQRLLAKDPATRFPDAASVVAALEPLAVGSNLEALWRRLHSPDGQADSSATTGTFTAVLTSPGRPVSPAPVRRWLRWSMILVSMLAVIAAVFAAFQPGWFADPEPVETPEGSPLPVRFGTPTPVPDPGEPSLLDSLPVGVSHNLVDQPPRELCWPRNDPNAVFTHQREHRQITARCNGMALLELGRTRSPNFTLRVTLSQSRWEGGIGLFLGYNLGPKVGAVCQVTFLELRTLQLAGASRRITPTRGVIDLTRTGEGEMSGPTHCVAGISIPPKEGTIKFKIVVERGLLKSVSINDLERPEYVKKTVFKNYLDLPQTGSFGLYIRSSEGQFRDAEFERNEGVP